MINNNDALYNLFLEAAKVLLYGNVKPNQNKKTENSPQLVFKHNDPVAFNVNDFLLTIQTYLFALENKLMPIFKKHENWAKYGAMDMKMMSQMELQMKQQMKLMKQMQQSKTNTDNSNSKPNTDDNNNNNQMKVYLSPDSVHYRHDHHHVNYREPQPINDNDGFYSTLIIAILSISVICIIIILLTNSCIGIGCFVVGHLYSGSISNKKSLEKLSNV